MNDQTLKKLQDVETEILAAVDEFCRQNGITYSLYAGTALGAVRHGGFIPWDDDVDICMDRNEYQRFLRLWRADPPAGYTLVGDDEPDCHINHTKVHKNNTVLASEEGIKRPGHHGIWLDVFAMDKLPTDPKKRKKLLRAAKLRLLYTRGYPYSGGSMLLRLASRIMLLKTKKRIRKLKLKYDAAVSKYADLTGDFEYVGLECQATLHDFYPPDIFDVCDIAFNGKTLSITKKSDTMLSVGFGDYMTLPPEEERVCKHNPKIISFDAAADGY